MIQEDYVSFEVAKMIKNKGFDERCRASYDKNGNFLLHKSYYFQLVCGDGYLAPTLQMTCKWLRVVHNISIEPCSITNGYYSVLVVRIKEGVRCNDSTITYSSYEEAVEAALKYTLENLI